MRSFRSFPLALALIVLSIGVASPAYVRADLYLSTPNGNPTGPYV